MCPPHNIQPFLKIYKYNILFKKEKVIKTHKKQKKRDLGKNCSECLPARHKIASEEKTRGRERKITCLPIYSCVPMRCTCSYKQKDKMICLFPTQMNLLPKLIFLFAAKIHSLSAYSSLHQYIKRIGGLNLASLIFLSFSS